MLHRHRTHAFALLLASLSLTACDAEITQEEPDPTAGGEQDDNDDVPLAKTDDLPDDDAQAVDDAVIADDVSPEDSPTPDVTAAPDVAPAIDAPPVIDVPHAMDVTAPPDVPRDVSPPDVPRDTGAPDAPAGFDFPTPIEHVIVIVKENHTLDSMFTGFPGATTTATAVLSNGHTYTRPVAPDGALPSDIGHSHNCARRALQDGAMHGFDLNSAATTSTHDPHLAFVRYTERQLPNYWTLARNFVLCDQFFSDALANSSPGHFALWTSQTPMISNQECPGTSCAHGSGCLSTSANSITTINRSTCAITTGHTPCFDVPSVVDGLSPRLSWRVYGLPNGNGIVTPPIAMVRSLTRNRTEFLRHTGDQRLLVRDINANRLATITYLHTGGSAGEHPPRPMCPGDNFTAEVVSAVMHSPMWRSTAVLITYDDWGGFYDHVRPPLTRCSNGDHLNEGFRLPLIVVSPYARRAASPDHPYVFHTPTEQASIPRLIEDLFRLPRMSARDSHARDGRAGSLMGVFDFAHPNFSVVPLHQRACP